MKILRLPFTSSCCILLILAGSSATKSQIPPNDPLFENQWYLNMPGLPSQRADVRAVEAWQISTGASGIKLGVVEQDGIPSLFHPDLVGRVTGPGISVTDHATKVAGVLGAAANNEEGIAGLNWVSPMEAFVYDANSDQVEYQQAIASARLTNCNVINLSNAWDGFVSGTGKECAWAYSENRVLVASMHNNGQRVVRCTVSDLLRQN